MKQLKKYLDIFITFFKIGLFTFGGGYAMIPLIKKETVENKKWIKDEDILDIVAIAESTPGPIAINSATFVGYTTSGFFGALCATLGVVLPSFIIIVIISKLLSEFESIKVIQYAFFGIRAGVLALLLNAMLSMFKQCKQELFSYIIIGLSFGLAVFTDIEVIYILICDALLGLLYTYITLKEIK